MLIIAIAAVVLFGLLFVSSAASAPLPARWPPSALLAGWRSQFAALGSDGRQRYRALVVMVVVGAVLVSCLGLRVAAAPLLNAAAERAIREEHPWLAQHETERFSLSWAGGEATLVTRPKREECKRTHGLTLVVRSESGRWRQVSLRQSDVFNPDCFP